MVGPFQFRAPFATERPYWTKIRILIRKLLKWLGIICLAVLVWDASPTPGVDGYKVYVWLKGSSAIYTSAYVGMAQQAKLDRVLFPTLQPDTEYTFCVKALKEQLESACSNKVDWTRPGVLSKPELELEP